MSRTYRICVEVEAGHDYIEGEQDADPIQNECQIDGITLIHRAVHILIVLIGKFGGRDGKVLC